MKQQVLVMIIHVQMVMVKQLMIVRNIRVVVYWEKHQKEYQEHVKILMNALITNLKTLVKLDYKEIVFG